MPAQVCPAAALCKLCRTWRRRAGAGVPLRGRTEEPVKAEPIDPVADPTRLDSETPHPWAVSPAEARAIQGRLRAEVRVERLDVGSLRVVAGADLSFERGSNTVYAGFVLVDFPSLEPVEQAGVRTEAVFPYIPGLLSFREVPPLLEGWKGLSTRPDALICDGQGLAHPRRFGFACHLGLLLDVPTVGCAKSRLTGQFAPPGPRRGDWSPLIDRGETIGAALRTREGVTPVFVSIGHRCDLESAVELVLRCSPRVRLPETTRRAHAFVNELRRAGDRVGGD